MPFDMTLVGKPTAPFRLTYSWKDTALYALGIGAKVDELDYLYEGRGPKVVPSFAVVPKAEPMFDLLKRCGGDLSMLVHGGERILIKKPFAPGGTLTTTGALSGIYDMRRFAYVLLETETKDEAGEVVATTQSTLIFRDAGGFGGETPPKDKDKVSIPKDRPADFTYEEQTSKEQAMLYRLSGDANPLHADPEFARGVGFEQGPILHGLCTFGYMARHVAKGFTGGDATRLTGIEGSFKRPVWPGDTLVTEGWLLEPGKVALSVKVKERDEVVVGGAWATFAR
jgi:acyl dehydratase